MRRTQVAVGHGSNSLLAVAAADVGIRTPFVYRNIGDPLAWANSRGRRIRVRALLRRAELVVALWPGTAAALIDHFGVHPDRVAVIPTGRPATRFRPADPRRRSDARRRLGVPQQAPVVLYLGALSQEKDVGIAIEAVARVAGAVMVVVGGGPERARLEALAEASAPGRVAFRPVTGEPELALAAADVLVLPSLTEGLPGALIEAGLCGLPTVASAVGGVPEIVDDGVTGILVPPGDPAALAAGLVCAIEARQELGDAALRRCLDRFEMGVVAGLWEHALLGVVDEARL